MRQSTRRFLAYGGNATLVTVMVIAVLMLLQALSGTYKTRIDLSADGDNTLQSDTLAKLRMLDDAAQPVVITAFTAQRGKEGTYFKNRAVKDLLRELGERSTAVDWRQVDFDQERLTAEELGVGDYGRVVLQRGDDRVDLKDRELFRRRGKGADRHLEFTGEAAITRALSQLMAPTRRVVYVLSGHGDLAPDEPGPDGLSELAELLDQERYDLEALDLIRSDRGGELPTIPDDAAAVFVARPQRALTEQEEDLLLSWVGRGGPLLIAVDVGTPLPALLDRVGVSVPPGVVLQQEMQVPFRDRPIPRLRSHAITGELREQKLVTVVAHAAPVVTSEAEGVRARPVMSTTRSGWIERGGALVGGGAVYEAGIDGEGPVDLAVSLELIPGKGLVRSSKGRARIAVFGDGDAFTNALMGEGPGNATLALNTIHWLVGDDRRLGAGGSVGRATRVRRLALTEQEMGTLRAVTLGFMPGVVLLFGMFTWLSRRGR